MASPTKYKLKSVVETPDGALEFTVRIEGADARTRGRVMQSLPTLIAMCPINGVFGWIGAAAVGAAAFGAR